MNVSTNNDVCVCVAVVLTFADLLLGGLPAAVVEARHRLDVALADGWRVQHQLGGPGQADGERRRAHQDPSDP